MTSQSQLQQDEVGRLISADTVEGTTVYNPAGDTVGIVSNIMIDKISGKVAYAALTTGGIFGIGREALALPWNVLSYDTGKGGYVVDVDRAKLEEAPQMASDDLSEFESSEFEKHIHDYYNIDPYWTFSAQLCEAVCKSGPELFRAEAAPAGKPSRQKEVAGGGRTSRARR